MPTLFTALPRAARLYVATVLLAGTAAICVSASKAVLQPLGAGWLVLAALTIAAGSFNLKVPGVNARLSVSEAFVFTAILAFGTHPATVIVALESLILTSWLRTGSSPLRAWFNVSVGAISVWAASFAYSSLLPEDVATRAQSLSLLVWPVLALAVCYFLANSWLVAIALGFERSANPWAVWRKNFVWLILNYLAGASLSLMIATYARGVDIAAVGLVIPLFVIIYLTQRVSLARVDDANKHVAQLNELYMSTIETLAMAVDAKDQITHGHIRRVQVYAVELAKALGVSDGNQLTAIEAAALLHDMGKLAIPEHILNKPGKLTEAEFETMKRHAALGADLLSSIRFPYPVVPIVRHHHENWDGTGYPRGIAGADIPLGARILSVVDCFDALTSDRPYRPRLSTEDAFETIQSRRGSMYDPLIVDTFARIYGLIAERAAEAGQQATSFAITGIVRSDNDAIARIRAAAVETTATHRAFQRVHNAPSLQAAMTTASNAVRQLTPSTACLVFAYSQANNELECVFECGDNQSLVGLKIQPGERVSGWVFANRKSISNADAALDLGEAVHLVSPRPRSSLSVAIASSSNAEPIGVLTAYSPRAEAYSAQHTYALEQVAATLSRHMKSVGTGTPKLVNFQQRQ